MNRYSFLSSATILTLALAGCSGMTETQQRTLSGAAIGGAAAGLVSGDVGWAVGGAAVGAASGYIYDRTKQNEQRAYEQGVQDGRAQQ